MQNLCFSEHQIDLITQSKEAYTAAQNDAYELDRTARTINGCVVSESESDDPEQYTSLKDPLSDQGCKLISKPHKAIYR